MFRNQKTSLIIATRASQLAMVQARMVGEALQQHHPYLVIEYLSLTTQGDQNQTQNPAQWGYKGLFTKEIEEALQSGRADIAVHSMKDMPSHLPDGLMLAGMLPREDMRDALVSNHHTHIESLPHGAKVGCSSVRRTALLRHLRPDLEIVPFRGNVNTRLAKLDAGEVDATLLAVAGLKRLGLEHRIASALPLDVFLPAVAQGAIGIECREDDAESHALITPISHAETFLTVSCERALLARLDGSCKTPMGGLASLHKGILTVLANVILPDGSRQWIATHTAPAADAIALGTRTADDLLHQMNADGVRLNAL